MPRKYDTITDRSLRRACAHPVQRTIFRRVFPDGIKITTREIPEDILEKIIAANLDAHWWRRVLPDVAGEEYARERTAAREERDRARVSAGEEHERAWEEYDRACACVMWRLLYDLSHPTHPA